MDKKLYALLLFISCAFLSPANAQDDHLVDVTFLGSRTRIEMLADLLIIVDYDIHLYKIRYKTTDVNMRPDTASGLIVVPQVPPDTKLPLVLYAHGTTSGPADVPSNLRGGYQVAMGYAGFGFAAVAPDYLGLGDSGGFHPYLHAGSEASASLDMILAAQEFFESNDPDLDPQFLFLAGYSQGAHTSSALHRELEKNWSLSLPVTAATHMSGPYSISGIMKDRILSDEPYGFPAYIAYIFLSYNDVYNLYDGLDEVFKGPYVPGISLFYQDDIDLNELNEILLDQLASNGEVAVKGMLQDSIVDALSNNPGHPLNIALHENDTYEWAPEAPTRLYYCGMDQQVPPYNSILADSVMRSLGAPDVQAINLNSTFDHGPCVFPAILNSKNFFESFLQTSFSETEMEKPADFIIYPNPFYEEVRIEWLSAGTKLEYDILNVTGMRVQKGFTENGRISFVDLPSGIYTLIFSTGSETRSSRLIHL